MAPLSRTPERDLLNLIAYEQKKTRSVTDFTALTLCRGTVPTCRRVARSANVYIPVRSNVNNGSECAPLNFVMASAAFRLCGHHRGRHIALRINSSMIGTSRADFRSSCGKSLSNASDEPLESMTSVLSGSGKAGCSLRITCGIMVLRGRLDLRCVRMSKSLQVIDSHNALIQVTPPLLSLLHKFLPTVDFRLFV